MPSLNFHVDHLPDEDRPKAEAELHWMVQETHRLRQPLPRIVVLIVIAAAFAAGMLWERGERLYVLYGGGALALAVMVCWLTVMIRRRRRFSKEWEMTLLRWHAARNQLKEGIRTHDAKEAAAQAKEESRLRSQIMDLLSKS